MEDIPDVYSDQARISFSAGGVSLIFLRSIPTLREGEEQVEPEGVAIIRMSHSMANQVAELIQRSLETLEKQAAEQEPQPTIVQSGTTQPTPSG